MLKEHVYVYFVCVCARAFDRRVLLLLLLLTTRLLLLWLSQNLALSGWIARNGSGSSSSRLDSCSRSMWLRSCVQDRREKEPALRSQQQETRGSQAASDRWQGMGCRRAYASVDFNVELGAQSVLGGKGMRGRGFCVSW